MSLCPSCGSGLVQPLRWKQRDDGDVLVELRCPECLTVMQACHTPQDMQELDRLQHAGRESIQAAYEASVRESMAFLADRMRDAFDRDLIGPDDFATRRPRAA